VTTLLTATISTALLQFNVDVTTADLHPPDTMTGIEWAVTVLLAVLNIGTFALLAGIWLRTQCARAQRIVRRTSFVVALTGRMAGLRASLARRRSTNPSTTTTGTPASLAPVHANVTGKDMGNVAPTPTENPLRARTGAATAATTPAANPTRVTTMGDAATKTAPLVPSSIGSRRVARIVMTPTGAAVMGDEVVVANLDATTPNSSRAPLFVEAGSYAGGVAFAATPVGRSCRVTT